MDPFQLLVKPAAGDCNLACEYCFYKSTTPELYPADNRHRMSTDTMELMVKDLLSYRFPETIFCWQGGEPTLMGLDFFERVIKTQMDSGTGGQVVGNALQTNGVLIDGDWAEFLARYQFVVGLSLDGPRDVHDHYRHNHGGDGTFERVMETAELFRKHGVTFNILSVVNRVSQHKAAEVYRFLRAQGFDYLQFIPCLETDPQTGEVTDFSATPDGLARFYTELFEEYRINGFPNVSERNFDALMCMHVNGVPGVCTFQERCGSYLVVEYNGDIYPCDFFVDEKFKLGNLKDKKLAEFFDEALMKNFAKTKADVPDGCGRCKSYDWCHGGCLKDRLPDRASATGKTYFCESYKALFEATDKEMSRWAEALRASNPQPGPPVDPGRVGRNDPCPCGSGKKFKKCCGR